MCYVYYRKNHDAQLQVYTIILFQQSVPVEI